MVSIQTVNDRSARLLSASAVASSHTGDMNETALATITITAGAMGLNGIIRIVAIWSGTSSGNGKTFRCRFSTISGTVFRTAAQTTNISNREFITIQNRGAMDSQIGSVVGAATGGWSPSSGALVTAAVDTSAETTLVLSGQLADSGDTITLESYSVELLTL